MKVQIRRHIMKVRAHAATPFRLIGYCPMVAVDCKAFPKSRHFLFLQGMATCVFARLAMALRARGHRVSRVNFNAGDRLFWPLRGAVDFRGKPQQWQDFLKTLCCDRSITDIILFGDCRPLHRTAISLAKEMGIAVHVFEEGYLRPNWVTLEKDGVNGYSMLPRDPNWYREAGLTLPSMKQSPNIRTSFSRRVFEDLSYNVATLVLAPLYPNYKTHRPYHRMVEYAGWSLKVIRRPWARKRTRAALTLLSSGKAVFLFPLQLNSDSQIRVHSPFSGMQQAIEVVIGSFARSSPARSQLLIKEHPLDDGLVDWRSITTKVAEQAGIPGRVTFLETGSVDSLVTRANGVVTVNSTTGMLALSAGKPVITIGSAIYDLPGLTYQGTLDSFWRTSEPPDQALFSAFCGVISAYCMIPGDFFSKAGVEIVVKNAIARLESDDNTLLPNRRPRRAVVCPNYDRLPRRR